MEATSSNKLIYCQKKFLIMATEPITGSATRAKLQFLRTVLWNMEKVYLSRNPTARAVVDLVRPSGADYVCYDHFTFRALGVDGYDADSLAKFFLDFGYSQQEELKFPAKKMRALWYSPPETDGNDDHGAEGCLRGPLPKIVIAELLVNELTSQNQEIIRKYTKAAGYGNKYVALASIMGCLPWDKPTYSECQELSRESEFAAWTLVNGYLLGHITIAIHRLDSHIRNIKSLNYFIEDHGFKLNSERGVIKASPDGLLLQSSTIADSDLFTFADGVKETITTSYIEFAERLVLPQYENLAAEEIKDFHRRDGFEVSNGYGIMESTSKEQMARKATAVY